MEGSLESLTSHQVFLKQMVSEMFDGEDQEAKVVPGQFNVEGSDSLM